MQNNGTAVGVERLNSFSKTTESCPFILEVVMVKCFCLECGKGFVRYPSDIQRGGGKYCSRKCCLNNLPKYTSEGQMGIKNSRWLGDKAGRNTIHAELRRNNPHSSICFFCGKKTKKLHLANLTGQYTRNINDYAYLCHGCHILFDYRQGFRRLPTEENGRMFKRNKTGQFCV